MLVVFASSRCSPLAASLGWAEAAGLARVGVGACRAGLRLIRLSVNHHLSAAPLVSGLPDVAGFAALVDDLPGGGPAVWPVLVLSGRGPTAPGLVPGAFGVGTVQFPSTANTGSGLAEPAVRCRRG